MNQFLTWCDERTVACHRRRQALAADQRTDEARFEQIRANVYGVFRAVCATLQSNPAALEKKLREIPAAWEESLRQAQQYGDSEKAYIEQLKLDTAEEILREVPHD